MRTKFINEIKNLMVSSKKSNSKKAKELYELIEPEIKNFESISKLGFVGFYNEYGYIIEIFANGYRVWQSDNYGNSEFDDICVGLDDPTILPLEEIKRYTQQTGEEMAKEYSIPFLGIEYNQDEIDQINEIIEDNL